MNREDIYRITEDGDILFSEIIKDGKTIYWERYKFGKYGPIYIKNSDDKVCVFSYKNGKKRIIKNNLLDI